MALTLVNSAEAYYNALKNKDLSGMAQYLHPNVRFIGPLAEMTGKEAVLEAAKNFFPFVKGLTIRSKFGSGNQAMLAYDLECPPPIGMFRAATLMTFEDSFISCIELFYDARPFEQKKDEIFTQ